MSYMEGEALAKKKDPGPQHKYTLNYELQSTRPKTPFYVSMSKSQGRGERTIKKDKAPGPSTYQTEKPLTRVSSYHKPINVVNLSGFAVGNGNNVTTGEKLRLKSNRFIDQITKKQKKLPGVGQYVNVEKAIDNMKSRPVTSLRQKRH